MSTRYPRARDTLDARMRKSAGNTPTRFRATVRTGPLSPAVAAEFARVRFDMTPRQAAFALEAIHAAASGETIRLHGAMIITAAGNGEVNVDLPRGKS